MGKSQEDFRRKDKLQLRQELNYIKQKKMSVSDYTSKIKSICDSLGSINVNIDEAEMVHVTGMTI